MNLNTHVCIHTQFLDFMAFDIKSIYVTRYEAFQKQLQFKERLYEQ